MMMMVMMVVRLLTLVDTLCNKNKSDNNDDVACQIVQEQQNNVSQVTQNSGQKNDPKLLSQGDKEFTMSRCQRHQKNV